MSASTGLWTLSRLGRIRHASVMPYFLEYSTDQGVGRFAVEGTNLSDAVAKARTAIQGLDCTSAALRHTPHPHPAFGEGLALAVYTRAEGWKTQEPPPVSE